MGGNNHIGCNGCVHIKNCEAKRKGYVYGPGRSRNNIDGMDLRRVPKELKDRTELLPAERHWYCYNWLAPEYCALCHEAVNETVRYARFKADKGIPGVVVDAKGRTYHEKCRDDLIDKFLES